MTRINRHDVLARRAAEKVVAKAVKKAKAIEAKSYRK
jgi:hypothetical protein